MLEKPFFEKLNKVADWIIRLVVINVFVMIMTIPIITFYVGFRVAYEMLSDYVNGKNTSLFKGIWENLKKDFWKNLGYGALLILFFALAFKSTSYYNKGLQDGFDWFMGIGYFVSLMFLFGMYIIMIYSLSVAHVYSDLKIKDTFKLSLYLAGRYFLRTLLLLLVNSIPIMMFTEFFLQYQITLVIFAVVGLAVPLVLNVLITKKPVEALKGENENV